MTTKKEQTAHTTAVLVDIARSMFAERGYAGVGLEDVAARADVTRGAVYHHFKSKTGLFAAVLDSVSAQVADAVSGAAAAQTEPWEQLVHGCHAFLDAACADDVRRILLIDGPAVLGWTRWRESDSAHSGALLREGLASLVAAPDPTATMLSGAMNEAALWLTREDVRPADSVAAHAVLDRLLSSIET